MEGSVKTSNVFPESLTRQGQRPFFDPIESTLAYLEVEVTVGPFHSVEMTNIPMRRPIIHGRTHAPSKTVTRANFPETPSGWSFSIQVPSSVCQRFAPPFAPVYLPRPSEKNSLMLSSHPYRESARPLSARALSLTFFPSVFKAQHRLDRQRRLVLSLPP
jgi:hypothetical protein